jgi:hypothetical protein
MALMRSATANPTPTQLVASGVRGLAGSTKDLAYLMAYSNAPDTTNQNVPRIDLQLANGTTPGALTTLLAPSTGEPAGFTATGSHAVYITDLPATGGPVGTVRAKPVAGGAEIVLAQNAAYPQMTTAGAKVLWMDNFVQVGTDGVSVTVEIADLAGAATATAVVDGVDPGFYADDKNVYATVAGQGLFMKALP